MLGSINGHNTVTNETGTIYGNYSFGNLYDRLLDEDALREMQEIVGTNLKIAGVLSKISSLDVMDVGTGRQAFSMALLKAKSVEHFDISEEHVNRFNKLIRSPFQSADCKPTIRLVRTCAPSRSIRFCLPLGDCLPFSQYCHWLEKLRSRCETGRQDMGLFLPVWYFLSG